MGQDHLLRMPVPGADSDIGAVDSVRHVAAEALLDNPILNALLTDHESLASGDGPARRYPAAIGPLLLAALACCPMR